MVAKTLNNYFTDLTKNLELKENRLFSRKDTIADIVDYFKDCDSIRKIKETYNSEVNAFSLSSFTEEEIKDAIKHLPNNKATVSNDIPVKILKASL